MIFITTECVIIKRDLTLCLLLHKVIQIFIVEHLIVGHDEEMSQSTSYSDLNINQLITAMMLIS